MYMKKQAHNSGGGAQLGGEAYNSGGNGAEARTQLWGEWGGGTHTTLGGMGRRHAHNSGGNGAGARTQLRGEWGGGTHTTQLEGRDGGIHTTVRGGKGRRHGQKKGDLSNVLQSQI